MSKREKTLSVSAGLLRLGDALRFSPEEDRPAKVRESRSWRLIPSEKLLGFKNAVARMREQSFFLSLADGFVRGIFLTRFRSFAPLFFISGFLQTVSYFTGSYFSVFSGNQDNLIFGLVLIVLGLACSFERAGFGAVLKKSVLFRRVIRPLFGVEEREIPEGRNREHFWWTLGLGFVWGILSVAFSPYRVLLWFSLTVTGLVTLYKPEAGLVFLAMLYPFLSRGTVLGLVVMLHLSLAFKITVGKRSLILRPADLSVLALMLIFVIRGGKYGLPYALTFSAYFLALHLCRTAAWMRRVVVALSVSVGISSGGAVALKLIERAAPGILRRFPGALSLFSALVGREQAFLAAMLLPMLFCVLNTDKRIFRRLSAAFFVLTASLSLAASHDAGLWLGAAAGLVLTLCLSRRWGLLVSLYLGLSGYIAWKFLPEVVRAWIVRFIGLDAGSMEARSASLARGREYLRQSLPWGAGFKTDRTIIADAGVYDAAGAFGGYVVLIAAAVIFLWFFVRCMRFAPVGDVAHAHTYVLGAMAGALVWLVCGFAAPSVALEPLFVLALFLSFPKAAENICLREEYSQPY